MQKLMKFLITGMAIVAGTATAAENITLTVNSFPDFNRAVLTAIPLYKKLHPEVEIKLTTMSFWDHHAAMNAALTTGANPPDVMAVEVSFIGKFAEAGGLEDLGKPPYDALQYRSKLSKFSVPQGMNDKGELIAMPADIGPGAMFYRKDLLEKAGVSEAELTASWDSFIQAGKKLKAATGTFLIANAIDLKNTYIRSGIKEGEGMYFDHKGEPLITTERFQKAFQYAKAVRDAGIDAKLNVWSNDWTEGARQDKFAVQMMGAWFAGHLKNWVTPKSVGNWRAAQLPGGSFASWGGSFYAIPTKAQHKEAAWEFIKFMSLNKDMQIAAFRELDAFPALIEAQSDPIIDQPIDFLGGQKARQFWKISAAKIQGTNVDKFDPLAEDLVNAAFEKVITQGKDIPTALADAQALLKKRMRR